MEYLSRLTHCSALPFIELASPNDPNQIMKFQIDTGSTYSFVDPDIIPDSIGTKLDKDIQVNTILNNFNITHFSNLTTFKKFLESGISQFLFFKFHPYFNVLLGIDFLT